MNIAIIDVSEHINHVYGKHRINNDDGNLLHLLVTTSMFTLYNSAGAPEAKHSQILNDLHGYVATVTTPTYELVNDLAMACFHIVNRLINQYSTNNQSHITVLNTTRTSSGYTMRVGYY